MAVSTPLASRLCACPTRLGGFHGLLFMFLSRSSSARINLKCWLIPYTITYVLWHFVFLIIFRNTKFLTANSICSASRGSHVQMVIGFVFFRSILRLCLPVWEASLQVSCQYSFLSYVSATWLQLLNLSLFWEIVTVCQVPLRICQNRTSSIWSSD